MAPWWTQSRAGEEFFSETRVSSWEESGSGQQHRVGQISDNLVNAAVSVLSLSANAASQASSDLNPKKKKILFLFSPFFFLFSFYRQQRNAHTPGRR